MSTKACTARCTYICSVSSIVVERKSITEGEKMRCRLPPPRTQFEVKRLLSRHGIAFLWSKTAKKEGQVPKLVVVTTPSGNKSSVPSHAVATVVENRTLRYYPALPLSPPCSSYPLPLDTPRPPRQLDQTDVSCTTTVRAVIGTSFYAKTTKQDQDQRESTTHEKQATTLDYTRSRDTKPRSSGKSSTSTVQACLAQPIYVRKLGGQPSTKKLAP